MRQFHLRRTGLAAPVLAAAMLVIGPAVISPSALAAPPPNATAAARPLPAEFYGPLPVVLDKIASQRVGIADRNAVPAGADVVVGGDSARHPNPVILIHGTADNSSSAWLALAPLLRNSHFNVFTFNHGRPSASAPAGGLTGVARSAAELAVEVAKVRRLTGAAQVDLVGHSQGGVIAQWYVNKLGGDRYVRRVVALASPNFGITAPAAALAGVGLGASGLARDLAQGSDFYRELHKGSITRPNVGYTLIGSRYDEIVVPHSSAYLPAARNVTNIELQQHHPSDYADHFALPYDPYALAAVVHALDGRINWPIPPGVVAPYRGGYLPLR